jgi:aminopeptidase C
MQHAMIKLTTGCQAAEQASSVKMQVEVKVGDEGGGCSHSGFSDNSF